jgi:hypothetical protein
MAGYHQFHAVNVAIEATVTAARPQGDAGSGWSGTPRAPARA